jgi:O-antigen/teichoic acid export membrane protein
MDTEPSSSLTDRLRGLFSRFRGEVLFACGMVTAPVAGLLGGIISAHYLDPAEMGVFNTVALIPAYIGFLHLGVFSGLSRNFPLERGAGHVDKADELMRASGAVATLVGGIGAVICLALTVWYWLTGGDSLLVWAMAATTLPVFAGPLMSHVDTALRGLLEFRRLGWIMIASNGVSALASGLIIVYGAIGGVWRVVIGALLPLFFRFKCGVWNWKWKLNWPATRELMKVGFPMLLSATFFSFLMVADRSVVVAMMSKKDVGHFALAGMIVTSMQALPQSLAMALFPRMARHYGQHRSSRALRRYLIINLVYNVVMLVPLSLACYWLVDPLVRHFFPAYITGIPAAKIACLTGICWIYLGVGSVIGIVNRMTPYLIAMVVSLGVVWGLGIYLIKHGYGIEGAAWARFFGTLVLCIFTIGYSWYLTMIDIHPPASGDRQQ